MTAIKARRPVGADDHGMCERPNSSRPLILLLVADEPLREALRFALETEGYAISAPAAPDACLACADCRAAACVVIDDSDRTWPTSVGGRPTIVLTGDAERFSRRGVRGVSVVEKPLLDDALGRRLEEILKYPDLPGEGRDPDRTHGPPFSGLG